MSREPVDLRADLHGHVLDFVNDLDRRWFADHPRSRRYRRGAVDHEFCRPGEDCPALDGVDVTVVVTRLSPSMRTRMPIVRSARRDA